MWEWLDCRSGQISPSKGERNLHLKGESVSTDELWKFALVRSGNAIFRLFNTVDSSFLSWSNTSGQSRGYYKYRFEHVSWNPSGQKGFGYRFSLCKQVVSMSLSLSLWNRPAEDFRILSKKLVSELKISAFLAMIRPFNAVTLLGLID